MGSAAGPKGYWWTCGGSVCRPGSVTSGPSRVDGPTHVETTKSSIQCKRTRGQLGINLLQRYLQEPESPHRFDLHWRSCFGCPKESRPPIRARTSSLKYPVLSWKKSVAAHNTQKKTPWSLTPASCLQAMPSVGWQKKREPCKAPSSSRGAVLVRRAGTRRVCLTRSMSFRMM